MDGNVVSCLDVRSIQWSEKTELPVGALSGVLQEDVHDDTTVYTVLKSTMYECEC